MRRSLVAALLGAATVIAACLAPGQVTNTQPPAFFALSVRDLSASIAWYRSAFDLPGATPLSIPDTVGAGALLLSDGLVVELLQLRSAQDTTPTSLTEHARGILKVGIGVAGLEPHLARFERLGIQPVAGPFDDPLMRLRSVIVADNEGNLLQLFAPERQP